MQKGIASGTLILIAMAHQVKIKKMKILALKVYGTQNKKKKDWTSFFLLIIICKCTMSTLINIV